MNINLLIKPHNYQLQECGSEDTDGGKLGFWPDIRHFDLRICVDSCENQTTVLFDDENIVHIASNGLLFISTVFIFTLIL